MSQTTLPSSAAAWMSLLGNGGSLLLECFVGSLVVGVVLGVVLGALAMGIAHLRRRLAGDPANDIRTRAVEDVTPAG